MAKEEETPAEFGPADLERKINAIFGGINTLQHLQKYALLGDERILNFVCEDELIRMHLPFGLDDFIQRNILQASAFYENQLLKKLRTLDLFDEKGVYFDVGANIGNHTLFFSKVMKAEFVTCFEPQNIAYDILRKNIEINGIEEKVSTVQSLIGSKDGGGEITVHFGNRNLGATAFKEVEEGGFPMTSLDNYIAKQNINKLDFVKIDVEGMQMPLWEGAKSMLGDLKPVLWVELRDFKDEFTETADLLKTYGYRSVKLGAHDHVFTTA